MSLLSTWLGRVKSDASVEYTHLLLPTPGAAPIEVDKKYLRLWLRSARITEVRRWATKFHASVHARFELSDRAAGRREVMCVLAPDKTFFEIDPRHTDRLITVNEPLLGPVPWRGEVACDIGLFSVAASDLAKPYLSLLVGLTKTAGIASLTQAVAWAEAIRSGAETLFAESQRSQLEIGVSRTDPTLAAGHLIVARVPKGQLPRDLRIDPNDYGLIDAQGRPLQGIPYMVIGIEVLDARDDYAAIPDVRAAWEELTRAATAGNEDEVRQRFVQLRRVVGLSPDLVGADRRRVLAIFGRELAEAGYSIDGLLPAAPSLAAPPSPLEGAGAMRRAPASATPAAPRKLRRTQDLLTTRAIANADGPATARGPRGARDVAALERAAGTALERRLSMAELQALMLDLNVPNHELRRYFTIDQRRSRPFAPELAFDPATVAVQPPAPGLEGAMLLGAANRMARLRRQLAFKQRLMLGDARPVLVSEGDSWFQFPIFLDDVIDHLGAEFNIWSVDAAGDTLRNMVNGSGEYLVALRRQRDRVRALLFSGSGNDILGDDDEGRPHLLSIVRKFEAGRPAEWYLAGGEFDRRLRELEAGYRTLFESVAAEFPGLPVICHGYDHAIPGGYPGDLREPAWAAQDQWLGAPLRELGIEEPALQQVILRLMINRLNQRLRALCGGNNEGGAYAHAWHVDARGAVAGRWADELHPDDDGYATVAERFAATLQRALALSDGAGGGALKTAAPAAFGALEAVHADCDAHDEGEPLAALEPAAPAKAGKSTKTTKPAKAMKAAKATKEIIALESAAAIPAAAPRPWRLAASLEALRSTVNAMAPQRSKLSDGTIGDAAHASRDSDHNPWVEHQGRGVVTAMDITHDPARGCDAGLLAESLREGRDPRIKYVIFDRRIFSATREAWQWRPYTGQNPHSHHMHISVASAGQQFDDSSPWQVRV
jgi:hypothetical protein